MTETDIIERVADDPCAAGIRLVAAGRGPEALALYDRAIRSDPTNALARFSRALLRLSAGDLAGGWRDYAYRLKIKGKSLQYAHGLPKWTGGVLKRTRLLVTAEPGIGDQIAFASIIPDLASWADRAGGTLLLEADPRLVALFVRSFPHVLVRAAEIDERGGARIARYDWLAAAGGADAAIELASLPRFLRRKIGDFPARRSYLVPDEADVARCSAWLRTLGPRPYIGLDWRSGDGGGQHAAPLGEWARFAASLGGTLVSLQSGATPKEIVEFAALSGRGITVIPALDPRNEIDRTAAFIAALDAVVSAPTAVSWIAAGLGVPTYKILADASWTSFGQDHEPFAPACRCMTPMAGGDWADVFARTVPFLMPAPRPA